MMDGCDESGVSYGGLGLCLGEDSYKVVVVLFRRKEVRRGNGDGQKASSLAAEDGLD